MSLLCQRSHMFLLRWYFASMCLDMDRGSTSRMYELQYVVQVERGKGGTEPPPKGHHPSIISESPSLLALSKLFPWTSSVIFDEH